MNNNLASGGEYTTTDTFKRQPCRIGLNTSTVQMHDGFTHSITGGMVKREVCMMVAVDSDKLTMQAGLYTYGRRIKPLNTVFLKIKSIHKPAKRDGIIMPLVCLN